ncbi:hypothetical protein GOZ97_22780 [Agrobacterium vitis]|uniref:hypothetical protein n=1 Tax=Rhizobium/Agrobacterium group TaxID=227290 RepID=UPI0008DBEF8B|nr:MULTISPECIES: hypothetical protein [Rhizobium/Agrobacterium group]MCF1436814.1 hypothetical protein [Allorhizobium ampelinum]MUO92294.1 hypothetical protein [Agrobacterium vitis]MUZ55115.1 hypothetical protein [Agrobacterium vitis]MUZ94250.1 hypothetical protein [Agrobacterium vitis]MVA42943.1 hypothetical protein [Agrobacterium vitis]
MSKVIDPVGTAEHISETAARVLEQTKHAMEAKKMENAIQVHTPHQIAAAQVARTVTPMEMLDRAASSGAGVETLTQPMALRSKW